MKDVKLEITISELHAFWKTLGFFVTSPYANKVKNEMTNEALQLICLRDFFLKVDTKYKTLQVSGSSKKQISFTVKRRDAIALFLMLRTNKLIWYNARYDSQIENVLNSIMGSIHKQLI